MTDFANCVVVAADTAHARLFALERDADLQSGARLRELEDLVNSDYAARGTDAPGVKAERNTSREAGPMHPQGEERQSHRAELERRFGKEVASHAIAMLKVQNAHALVLVAEPKMLGHIRAPLHDALDRGMHVAEWGRNYTSLAPDVLLQRLAANHLLPGRASVAGA